VEIGLGVTYDLCFSLDENSLDSADVDANERIDDCRVMRLERFKKEKIIPRHGLLCTESSVFVKIAQKHRMEIE